MITSKKVMAIGQWYTISSNLVEPDLYILFSFVLTGKTFGKSFTTLHAKYE